MRSRRVVVVLACTQCGSRNYTTPKDRVEGRLERKKFCPRCNAHTTHRETR